MKPTMLILSFSPIAADARVLKQVALFSEEWEVVTVGYGPAPDGVVEHITIPDDLAVWRYPRLSVMLRQFRRAYARNPVITYVREALVGRSFDVVLANDVDPVGIALELAPRYGVHADLHEYSPRQREDLLRIRLFVRPFIEWMCRHFVARADSWTTVSGGVAREYGRRFGFTPEIVVNAAPAADLTPGPVAEPLRLVHSGACMRGRSLHLMIQAVQAARTAPTLDLYLTPNDPSYLEELRALASRSPRTRVSDPVPYRDLVSTLNAYDVGVFLLPPSTFNYRWALPNKLFDYVQARLGMIVGPSPEMAGFVTTHHVGVVTPDFSSAALTEAIESLSVDEVTTWKRTAHGLAGELSAEQQVTGWARAVSDLVDGRR
ncbi:glycosyltransferase family 1 protein [Microbacterium sp. NPDC055357]